MVHANGDEEKYSVRPKDCRLGGRPLGYGFHDDSWAAHEVSRGPVASVRWPSVEAHRDETSMAPSRVEFDRPSRPRWSSRSEATASVCRLSVRVGLVLSS